MTTVTIDIDQYLDVLDRNDTPINALAELKDILEGNHEDNPARPIPTDITDGSHNRGSVGVPA